MKRPLTNTGKILQTLDRSFGLTRAELANRLGESRETIRKTLHVMLKDERITRFIGEDGIEIYNITETGKVALNKEMARVKEETSVIKAPFTVEEAIESKLSGEELADFMYKLNRPKGGAWETLVEEAEQRGFAKGYATGVQEAQRAAYELGKSSVISKLTEILR